MSGLIAPYVENDPTAFYTYDEFTAGTSTLRDFCRLRGESVAGQLSETIPSTEEGQLADGNNLISADGVNLSDMGTMNFGRNNGDMPSGMAMPVDAETAATPETADESAEPEDNAVTDKAEGFSSRERRLYETNAGTEGTDNMTLLLVCVGVLAIGVIITALTKGKNT